MKKLQLTALASAMFAALSVNAAVVTESFTVTVYDGEFVGTTGTGTFSYDELLVTGVGEESISAFNGLTLELSVFGQTFTESDDVDYSGYPTLYFSNGNINALDFYVSEIDCFDCGNVYNTTNILQDGVNDFSMYALNAALGGGFEGAMFVNGFASPVPVPAAVWLFGSGLIGLAGIARRKKA